MDPRSDSERLAIIETTITILSHRLLGDDGNGGELDSLHKRVSRLENWRWWVVGIGIGAGAVIGWNGNAVARALLK